MSRVFEFEMNKTPVLSGCIYIVSFVLIQLSEQPINQLTVTHRLRVDTLNQLRSLQSSDYENYDVSEFWHQLVIISLPHLNGLFNVC